MYCVSRTEYGRGRCSIQHSAFSIQRLMLTKRAVIRRFDLRGTSNDAGVGKAFDGRMLLPPTSPPACLPLATSNQHGKCTQQRRGGQEPPSTNCRTITSSLRSLWQQNLSRLRTRDSKPGRYQQRTGELFGVVVIAASRSRVGMDAKAWPTGDSSFPSTLRRRTPYVDQSCVSLLRKARPLAPVRVRFAATGDSDGSPPPMAAEWVLLASRGLSLLQVATVQRSSTDMIAQARAASREPFRPLPS
ncbi:hypothetical protein B0T18DRAFT_421614 [Schizothecium vesticola]|uniref:Uncharacterized protein n=1 Tax=Schizothecium vesticola TaxID=314040 RepID=A0AA40BPY0_9PEZI|nr:hypothetical protein B0T18DRAFT_421614 [Schizothecium vesticola]